MSEYRVVVSADVGIINMAFSVVGFLQNPDGSFDFDVIAVDKVSLGTMRDPIAKVASNLLEYMWSNENLCRPDITHVFIEQQLSRAIKNTVLSYTTYSFFEMLRVSHGIELTTRFVPPKQKFEAVRTAFPGDVLTGIDFDVHGRDLKKLSVNVARRLFETYDVAEGLRALRENKKKDDVADSFLQAFALFCTIAKKSGNPIRTRRR